MPGTQFTRFTSTKVQILTPAERGARRWEQTGGGRDRELVCRQLFALPAYVDNVSQTNDNLQTLVGPSSSLADHDMLFGGLDKEAGPSAPGAIRMFYYIYIYICMYVYIYI